MKHLSLTIAAIALILAACTGNKTAAPVDTTDSTETPTVKDTALYGTVGEGTTMSTLELITEEGKAFTFELNQDSLADIQGGIFAGDRITLITEKGTEAPAVKKLINISSLLGKWTSLDRNFTIKDDGTIESAQLSESNPLTHWTMCNTNIILNADTFSILLLGPDSLELETTNGIFLYKRQK